MKKEYLDGLSNKKDMKKITRTNVLITKFFNKQFIHMHIDDNYKKKKFFFSYRNKYLNEFKKEKSALTTKMYKYKKRKTIELFRHKFTDREWEKISGDELINYISLDGRISATENGLIFIRDIIKIILSKYKDSI